MTAATAIFVVPCPECSGELDFEPDPWTGVSREVCLCGFAREIPRRSPTEAESYTAERDHAEIGPAGANHDLSDARKAKQARWRATESNRRRYIRQLLDGDPQLEKRRAANRGYEVVRRAKKRREKHATTHYEGDVMSMQHLPWGINTSPAARFERCTALPATPIMLGMREIQIPETGKSLDEIVSEAVRHTLQITGGNQSAAARILGISRPTLARKIRESGLRLGVAVGAMLR